MIYFPEVIHGPLLAGELGCSEILPYTDFGIYEGIKQDAGQGKLQILGSGLALPIRPPSRVQHKVAIAHTHKVSSRNLRCGSALVSK